MCQLRWLLTFPTRLRRRRYKQYGERQPPRDTDTGKEQRIIASSSTNNTTMATELDDASLIGSSKGGTLSKLFASCASDPRGSVHRAWGISLLFVVLYFAFAVVEMVQLQQGNGSIALLVASIWTGIVHLGLGVLGTFVLKRFPTSFSVGFLLGILVVLANQNLIMCATFWRYSQGSARTNHIFAMLGFTLFAVLTFMGLFLVHFKQDVVVAPMDIEEKIEDGPQSQAVSA